MQPATIHLTILVATLLLLPFGAFFFPTGRRVWNSLFELLILIAVIVGRWPAIFTGRLPNPDEAQKISGASTLWHHPEFWKWIDGPTAGPLSFYSLWLGKLMGLGFTYAGARMVASIFFAISLIALLRFFRNRFAEVPARVSVLPFVAFGSLVLFWDMVQYGNESTPLFLLCVGLWLAFPSADSSGPHYVRLALAGIALGAVPFAKLQVAPMAFFVGMTAVVAVLRNSEKEQRWKRVGSLVGGALTCATITAIYLTIYGLWRHFLISYVQNNLSYVGTGQVAKFAMLWEFLPFLSNSQSMLPLFVGTLLFVISCIWLIRSFPRVERNWTIWSLVMFVLCMLSIILPGRRFEHYQLLLIPSLVLLCGTCLCGLCSMEKRAAVRFVMSLVFLTVTTLPLAKSTLSAHERYWVHLGGLRDEFKPVSDEIIKHAEPGEMMAIWGWQPDLWVNTGLIQGTRDGNTMRQVETSRQLPYYRERYMFDITRNKPPVFVDASGPGRFAFDPRSQYGHETWPRLDKFISENYRLQADIMGIRIYLRNDRFPASKDSKPDG